VIVAVGHDARHGTGDRQQRQHSIKQTAMALDEDTASELAPGGSRKTASSRTQQQQEARREHHGAADEQQQLTKAIDGLGPVNVSTII